MLIDVKVDASKMEKWADELSARGLRNAIRRALDKAGTAARRVALNVIAQDIGVPKARLRDGVTKLRRTTLTNLSNSFTASKMRISMLATGATVTRPGGLTGSTYRLTGGGSANLRVPQAFIVNLNGSKFVAIRRGKSRLPIKGLYAEMPNQAMGQTGAAAQVAWQKEANAQLATLLPAELQKQLLAESTPYSAPADNGE